jgi:glycosyltransferase involved in cell wall biosynthesis
MKNPKVSVQVAVYNKEIYLPKCLNSILNQSLKDIEIVCVDDASTDNSLSILKDYQKYDNRIKIVKHTRNKGQIHARKSAFIAANGEFMAFVDADDFIESDMCELAYKKAVKECADFIQFNGRIYDPEHVLTTKLFKRYNKGFSSGVDCTFEGNEIFKHYAVPIRVNLCLSMFKKKLYKEVIPFISNDAPRRADDNILSFFLMYYARKYAFLNKIFYNYRASKTSANLTNISLSLAKSQIKGRSQAIHYAKNFAKANNIKWDNHKAPFSVFSRSLARYSADFMNRCYVAVDKDKDDLIRYYGDCFGGEGLLFFIKEVKNLNFDLTKANEKIDDSPAQLKGSHESYNCILRKARNIINSSRRWKTMKPLHCGIRKIRGYK